MSSRLEIAAAHVALACLCLLPVAACAQASPEARRLTRDESEAYQMSRELAFACSPYRHRRADGSESTIRRQTDALAGTAVHFRSIEGTYLVLERYTEDLAGHCLVLGRFGGAQLEPGSYPITGLAMSTVEEEAAAEDHSFFAMSAVRTPEENALLVVESGRLVIESFEADRAEGTFELKGFLVDASGRDRIGDAAWSGSFTAVRGAD
jgi:hypothetical protein